MDFEIINNVRLLDRRWFSLLESNQIKTNTMSKKIDKSSIKIRGQKENKSLTVIIFHQDTN